MTASMSATDTQRHLELADRRSAHNYAPLPVVVAHGEGAWLTDVEGKRYLDCLAAYSAVNFGHRHPALIAAAQRQLDRVTLVSRAFQHDVFGSFVDSLAGLCGKDKVLPMNTGAEAVETALKIARKWGYEVKGVPTGSANVVVGTGNFHGRTISIVSFSDDDTARVGFGPYTPGFRVVPYGDASAVADVIDENTVAVLLEPVQGEAGVIVPPSDYLPRVRELCDRERVLLLADEVQSGLGRTGRTFACEHVDVVPDAYILGKALGGGVVPVSAVVADDDVMGVLRPGEHGSTFGGNPLACAVGTEVVTMLSTGEPQESAARLGAQLHEQLQSLVGRGVVTVRGIGLWAGVDIDRSLGTGRQVCEELMARGVLAKDTHGATIRIAPPFCITPSEIDWLVAQLDAVLHHLRH